MSPDRQDKIFVVSQGEISEIKRFDVKSFGAKSISSNFEIVKLRDVIEKQPQYGANERSIDGNKEMDFRYIRITDIDEFGNLKDDERKTAEKIENKYIVNENDLLFARSGATAGKCYYVPKNIKGIFAGYMIRFVLNSEKCISKYLFYLTFTDFYKKRVEKISRAAAQPNINSQEYLDFEFPLPPLKTQQEIIDKMDSAIAEKKKMESECEKILKSIDEYVLSELGIQLPELKEEKMCFSVDFKDIKNGRIDVFYNKPEFNVLIHSLNNIDNKIKLGEICDEIFSGKRPQGGVVGIKQGVPSIGGEHIGEDGNIKTDNMKFISDSFHENNKLSELKENDILIVKDGATTGKIGIFKNINGYDKANINEHVFAVRLKKDIDPYYVLALLKCNLLQLQIKREITGGTITGIIKDSVENLIIPNPKKEIQNKIANEIKDRIKKADELKKQANEIYEKAKNEVEKMILGK